ncbi:trehalase-domain-containing protein [Phaffia rhodozyma]|uniref:Trehalase n=1 Tax=Phaffia rhodozyma TaxID=264483 RepID=A0A0F7SGX0_PHARH|nr:trehalase-domain-containing protein [Phaffia rhodozyma]
MQRPQLKTSNSLLFHDDHESPFVNSPAPSTPIAPGAAPGASASTDPSSSTAGRPAATSASGPVKVLGFPSDTSTLAKGGKKTIPAVHSDASEYYSTEVHSRARTFSQAAPSKAGGVGIGQDLINRQRRLSHDEKSTTAPRRFLIDVEETMRLVLEQEDTDGDFQICITDSGPKVMTLGTATSNGYKSFDVRGNYMLSNLLQELALARDYGRKRIVLDEARLTENPVDRLSRMIRNSFWNALTRRIDGDGLEIICADPKNRTSNVKPLIYVPHGEPEMADYYREVSAQKPHLGLQVELLPPNPDDPAFVQSLNDRPGILALAMRKTVDPETKKTTFKGIPFIVPGARFNELYNWDSYFISLGLLIDGKIEMAKGMVEHFIFEIKHYGKILNGSRSYYLCRTQPPFLTDMALQTYNQLDRADEKANNLWLKGAIQAAIKEYHTIWVAEPRMDPITGLSRFRPDGLGIPPETEATHFTHILQPYADKHGISVLEFADAYNFGEIKEPELDEYFMHDRAVRESGHDTTYRFEKRCANLATIDLNALLYKYETDIATAIRDVFNDSFEMEEDFPLSPFPITPEAYAQPTSTWARSTGKIHSSAEWFARAEFRKQQIDKYLWNEGQKLYYDYDTAKKRQSRYESVTAFWALWAGCASEDQALKLVRHSLSKFEVIGGLVPGTEESRGKISLSRPNRQWDFPYAWPPHQIMAWVGLERYGFIEEASRLAYRWIYMMTVAFVDFNGVVPEKFDAVKLSHMVDAEYGNQGVDFKFVAREGFGWTNASFQVGLSFLSVAMRRAVSACVNPDVFFGRHASTMKGLDLDINTLGSATGGVDSLDVATKNLGL